LAEALVRVDTPDFRHYLMTRRRGLFSGQLETQTTGFTAGGLRMRWTTEKSFFTRAMGHTSGTTAVPKPLQVRRYEDVVYEREHFNDLMQVIRIDQETIDYINAAPVYQDGLEDVAADTMLASVDSFAYTLACMQVADTRNIYGTIVAATNLAGTAIASGGTDNTCTSGDWGYDPQTAAGYEGRYEFYLYLGQDAIGPALEPGSSWTVCAAPTYYGAGASATNPDTGDNVGNAVNYPVADASGTYPDVPIKILQMPEVIDGRIDGNSAIYKVKCCIYYTDSTHKTAIDLRVKAITAGAMGTGNVLCPYGGVNDAADGADALRLFGPNFGIQGLLHWLFPFDIQDAYDATVGGAYHGPRSTATALGLKDTQGNTIDRAGDEAFWRPQVLDKYSSGLTDIAYTQLITMARQMALQHGGQMPSSILPIAHSTLVDSIADEIGGGQFRQTVAGWGQVMAERWVNFGYSGVVLQGSQAEPTAVAVNDWVPPYVLPFIALDTRVEGERADGYRGDFTLMSPKPGEWKDLLTGNIWHPVRDSSGNLVLSSQAFYMRGVQMHMYEGWPWGAILYVEPTAA